MGCLTTNLRSGDESPRSERFEAALRSVRFTSIRDVAQTSQMRKERSYTDRVANGSNRPFAALQDRPSERDGSARKRISARRSAARGAAIPQRRRGSLSRPGNEARGRSRADHHLAQPFRPSHSTNWPGRRRLGARCKWRCSNSNWQGASNIWPTPSPCARAPTKPEPHGFSIERTVLLVQSNCRLVGFLLCALGFGGAVGANKYFAFRFRHPEKINQPVEAGRDRHGFEFGGHAGDVTGNVEHFPRHSPVRRIVASSRRSRWSAPSGSPISAFRFHETHLRGHPIKLSHVRPFAKRSAANPDCQY